MENTQILDDAAQEFAIKIQTKEGTISRLNALEWFKAGAIWQQERTYSKEDMEQFACDCVTNFLSNSENKVETKLIEVIIDRNNEQFNKFKNKLKS